MEKDGLFLHLQRLSTEDGPGIRTTVFLKGCFLSCAWCHNPESISGKVQVQHIETTCIHCGTCLLACPQGCLLPGENGTIQINRTECDGCGECVRACPTGAMELLGKSISAPELTNILLKDRSYYETSGGGVTFSGGEPALQAGFCSAVMSNLQEVGVHTALDTCGLVSGQQLLSLLPYTNLVLFDLKLMDPQQHQQFTGISNTSILNNLLLVRDTIANQPNTRLWIRTPLIPQATDSRKNLISIGDFLAKNLPGIIDRWELCAFNNLCRDKYRRLNLVWDYADTPLFTQTELDQRLTWAMESSFPSEKIILSGASRVKNAIGGE
jgi:pyruvate formate lyase activating enzyme